VDGCPRHRLSVGRIGHPNGARSCPNRRRPIATLAGRTARLVVFGIVGFVTFGFRELLRLVKKASLRPRRPSLRLALPTDAAHIQRGKPLDIPVQGVCPAAVDVEMAALSGQLVQIQLFQRIARRGQAVGGLQDGDPLVEVYLVPVHFGQPVDRDALAIRLLDVAVGHS